MEAQEVLIIKKLHELYVNAVLIQLVVAIVKPLKFKSCAQEKNKNFRVLI